MNDGEHVEDLTVICEGMCCAIHDGVNLADLTHFLAMAAAIFLNRLNLNLSATKI